MSGFLLQIAREGRDVSVGEELEEHARSVFHRKHTRHVGTLEGERFKLSLFSNPSHDPAESLATDDRGNCCTYVGTLIYRGLTGRDASAAILMDEKMAGIDCLDSALGNYCVIIKNDRGVHLVTDRAGLFHVYHTTDLSLISSSYIALAMREADGGFHQQEILEYVLLGATFGSNTMVKDVRLLGCEETVLVRDGRCVIESRSSVWVGGTSTSRERSTIEGMLEQTLESADSYYRQVAAAYRDWVTAALSGGYDSRLNLALLLRHGVEPRLFVHGGSSDPDVQIANLICRAEGFELRCIDRMSHVELDPDKYWENQEEVFHVLDGLTQYGFVCEPFEVSHRRARVENGLLPINGGGGEIWRDFWKVPDRTMTPGEFVRSYFPGRFPADAARACSVDDFLEGIACKVEELSGTRLTSEVVQSLYARLRLRFWQGRNNSSDNVIGLAITPFSEVRFSRPAMWIPLAAKRNDWFQGELIRRVSPSLARYPSTHGHSIAKGPGMLRRALSQAVARVPLPMRVAWRGRRPQVRRRYFQSDSYVAARFGERPYLVERYLDLSKLTDVLSFSRALTVERQLRGQWQ